MYYKVSINFFRLSNLKQSDSGYYLCYGKNSQGSNRDYVYVNVQEDAREEETNKNEEESSNNQGSSGQEEVNENNQSPPVVKIIKNEDIISILEGEL